MNLSTTQKVMIFLLANSNGKEWLILMAYLHQYSKILPKCIYSLSTAFTSMGSQSYNAHHSFWLYLPQHRLRELIHFILAPPAVLQKYHYCLVSPFSNSTLHGWHMVVLLSWFPKPRFSFPNGQIISELRIHAHDHCSTIFPKRRCGMVILQGRTSISVSPLTHLIYIYTMIRISPYFQCTFILLLLPQSMRSHILRFDVSGPRRAFIDINMDGAYRILCCRFRATFSI